MSALLEGVLIGVLLFGAIIGYVELYFGFIRPFIQKIRERKP